MDGPRDRDGTPRGHALSSTLHRCIPRELGLHINYNYCYIMKRFSIAIEASPLTPLPPCPCPPLVLFVNFTISPSIIIHLIIPFIYKVIRFSGRPFERVTRRPLEDQLSRACRLKAIYEVPVILISYCYCQTGYCLYIYIYIIYIYILRATVKFSQLREIDR